MSRSSILIIDLALVFCSAAFAILFTDNPVASIAGLELVSSYCAASAAVGLVVLLAFGLYRPLWRYSNRADYAPIPAAAIVIAGGAVVLCAAFDRIDSIPRATAALQVLLILVLLVGVRLLRRAWCVMSEDIIADANATAGEGGDVALVFQSGDLSDLYLRAAAQWGHVRIAGLLSERDADVGRTRRGHRIVGTATHVAQVVRDLEVHGVYVNRIVVAASAAEISASASGAFLGLAEATTVRIDYLPDQLGMMPAANAPADWTPDNVRRDADDGAALAQGNFWRAKRALDAVGAAALLVVLSPLMIVIAIAIAIDLGLPIAFWQQRPGRHGRPFRLYKFRTMRAAHDEHGVPVPAKARLSTLGRLLRETHMDELLQLFNILSGKMSFVGPRPLLPADQPEASARRLLVRPGLTGWAQVMGGRRISAADKAALDAWYMRNACPTLEFHILLRTIWLMLFGERVNGAAIRRAWDELGHFRMSGAAGISSERARIVGFAEGEEPEGSA